MKKLSLESLKEELRYIGSRWLVLTHDIAMIPIAWILTYWIRYNLAFFPQPFIEQAISYIPLVVLVHTVTLLLFGVHRGIWRFISVPDLVRLVNATLIGTLVLAAAIFFLSRSELVPRSVFVLHGLFLVVLLGGPRLFYRLFQDRHISSESEKRVLIVGAGRAGEMLVRDLLRASPRVYDPVGFVDDDQQKLGKEIQGIRVMSGCSDIGSICKRLSIELVLIAIPSSTAAQMQRVVEICEKASVEFRTMPKLKDLVAGQPLTNFQRVQIEDLLGREPVSLDWKTISENIRNKRVLVTGGGGSIGSELCRQLARLSPERLVVFDRTEFNLYSIEMELSREFPDVELTTVLGDVRDRVAVSHLFEKSSPHVVFHAAAYKHVPLLQDQIRESINNNVVGTSVVADQAHHSKCESLVLISTDKAVNPTSVMGASKRLAEIYCQGLSQRSQTRFVTVRFGNVLGSAGSVIPLFRQQIEAGGPVTVTHPEVTRYFMTTEEACQLILQANALGNNSHIYVLDMGDPLKISYLARQMIRLMGLVPGEDIDISYIGLRPGEKLEEELFHVEEPMMDTGHEKILLAQTRGHSWNDVAGLLSELEESCQKFEIEKLYCLVSRMVPEFQSDSESKNDENAYHDAAVG